MEKRKKARKEQRCVCPYCEEELVVASSPLCAACGVALSYCVKCRKVVLDKEATVCPECGEPLKRGGKK